jgi:hypothetical protein
MLWFNSVSFTAWDDRSWSDSTKQDFTAWNQGTYLVASTIASIRTPGKGVRLRLASFAMDPSNMTGSPCSGTACLFARLWIRLPLRRTPPYLQPDTATSTYCKYFVFLTTMVRKTHKHYGQIVQFHISLHRAPNCTGMCISM